MLARASLHTGHSECRFSSFTNSSYLDLISQNAHSCQTEDEELAEGGEGAAMGEAGV